MNEGESVGRIVAKGFDDWEEGGSVWNQGLRYEHSWCADVPIQMSRWRYQDDAISWCCASGAELVDDFLEEVVCHGDAGEGAAEDHDIHRLARHGGGLDDSVRM